MLTLLRITSSPHASRCEIFAARKAIAIFDYQPVEKNPEKGFAQGVHPFFRVLNAKVISNYDCDRVYKKF